MVEVRIGDQHMLLGWDEWEERVAEGRVPEAALVRFEPVTGSDWVQAADLEMYNSVRTDAKRAFSICCSSSDGKKSLPMLPTPWA